MIIKWLEMTPYFLALAILLMSSLLKNQVLLNILKMLFKQTDLLSKAGVIPSKKLRITEVTVTS